MDAKRNPSLFYGVIFFGLAIILAAILYFWLKWNLYVVWLISAGVATFVAYGYDKMQAGRGGWRVPEMILHALSLAGGFVGGWLGMFGFRHKTQKTIFTVVLGLATVIWIVIGYFALLRQ
ncbi:MAG: DUF1294 domain-containing protein [Anaerolineae bacterium]